MALPPVAHAAPCTDFRRTWRTSRRALLQAGAVSWLGLSLPRLLAAQQQAGGTGKAKRCILLFMWGGPSQLDTFDMKPHAPAEIRGDFQGIDTSVPGLRICEHFQRMVPLMDRVALVRSLTHNDPAHLSSAHATLTGHRAPVLFSDADPPSSKDTPHLGSVMAKLRPASSALPSFVTLPWLAYHPAAPGGQAPGQHGGWLGKQYDPMLLSGDPNAEQWGVPELQLRDGVDLGRLEQRKSLLNHLAQERDRFTANATAANMDGLRAKACELLLSSRTHEAFDLSQETAATRDRYGRNTHGQCVLLARRLVEQGVPLVNVNWHDDGRSFWDTHGNNFNRLKDDLIPPADQALAALLTDLEERGMLEDTIVAWVGEFGRRPQITAGNAGREHWPFCYVGLLAGGGIRGGAIYGESDNRAAYPARDPVTPQDFAATIYQALGVPADLTLPDQLGRPLRVCEGTPIGSLFS
ncbi:MAG: DUF1501 domain-containing protein [Planctomycetia bacterium]|nr:DUF1501 domain-containing protein [Planctomycetia bacterium]